MHDAFTNHLKTWLICCCVVTLAQMKCPQCVEKKEESKLTLSITNSTCLAGPSPYYDEQGNYHAHDPNTSFGTFSCSKGHKGKATTWKGCASCKEEEYNMTLVPD